jgi:hypothetical protein
MKLRNKTVKRRNINNRRHRQRKYRQRGRQRTGGVTAKYFNPALHYRAYKGRQDLKYYSDPYLDSPEPSETSFYDDDNDEDLVPNPNILPPSELKKQIRADIGKPKTSWSPFSMFTRKNKPTMSEVDKPKTSWLSRFTRKNRYSEPITVIKSPNDKIVETQLARSWGAKQLPRSGSQWSTDTNLTESSSDEDFGQQPMPMPQPEEKKSWFQKLFSGGKSRKHVRRNKHNKTRKHYKH